MPPAEPPPGAPGRQRLRLRSLRIRLLLVLLPVAVIAVLVSALVVNRQTRLEVLQDVRDELQKPKIIETAVERNATEQGWTNADSLVSELQRRYHLDIVLVVSPTGVDRRVVPAGVGIPDSEPVHVTPPPSADFTNQRLAIYRSADELFRSCLKTALISYTLKPSEEVVGLQVAVVNQELTDLDKQNYNQCGEQWVKARRPAEELVDTHPLFESAELYIGEPQLASGKLLSGGVSSKLMLTVAWVVGLASLAAVVASRRIARPVEALTVAAQHMAAGNLAERVDEDRADELGALSKAFNSMARSLQEADRLRRRMTSDVAHELRTPLSNIRGYLEAAQDGVAPLTAELIDSIHEDTLLLQALVTDLQELSVAESGQMRLESIPTDLDELASSVAAAHRIRAAGSGIRLTVEADSRLQLPVDPRRLRQVLTNLVENAIRHTDSGGRICVSVRRNGEWVDLDVTDTGTGIPAEHLPHIFERFYRADPSRARATGGTGLGLAITRELVIAHGGDLVVTSEVGVGSTFTVRLPLTNSDVVAEESPSQPASNGHAVDFTYIDVG